MVSEPVSSPYSQKRLFARAAADAAGVLVDRLGGYPWGHPPLGQGGSRGDPRIILFILRTIVPPLCAYLPTFQLTTHALSIHHPPITSPVSSQHPLYFHSDPVIIPCLFPHLHPMTTPSSAHHLLHPPPSSLQAPSTTHHPPHHPPRHPPNHQPHQRLFILCHLPSLSLSIGNVPIPPHLHPSIMY
jgi:hypothetical protein